MFFKTLANEQTFEWSSLYEICNVSSSGLLGSKIIAGFSGVFSTCLSEIRLVVNVEPSLIGGFLIKTDSKVIDFTVKNQLQKLAKHLDTVLEI